MKKTLRILSVVLALVLACSLVTSACAESGYVLIKGLLSTDQSDNPFYVSSNCFSYDTDASSYCMLVYDGDEQCLLLGGTNYMNKPEATAWSSVSFGDGLWEIYQLAQAWDLLMTYVDDGYMLVLGVKSGDDYIWITDSASAQTFVEGVESLLNQ